MIGAPEMINAGPEPATGKPALVSLTADERAELVWGDEANSFVSVGHAPAVQAGQWGGQHSTSRMQSCEMPMEERRQAILSGEISFITPTVVRLSISGIAAAGHPDFAPGDFIQPDRAWRPPYPYAVGECLWARP